MNRVFHRCIVASLHRLNVPAVSRPRISTIFFCAIFFSTAARAQFSSYDIATTHSASGQFIVIATPGFSPLFHRPELAANTALVRLEPSLLAVSAEHFKTLLWQQLGLKPGTPWSGQIFLALHPARSPDDEVTITTGPLLKAWNFRVDLPDVVTRARFARALAAVLLLEIASRNTAATSHAIEIPSWLADGLAQQALANDVGKVILSAPVKIESRINNQEIVVSPFASAHRTLQNFPALTFDQLCWPDDAQLNGTDGGAYFASAQLFVNDLLGLKNGAARMRALLAQLPGCYNWQTAFFAAFRDNFKRPLDVEKWWALRVVAFAARDPGPRWTPVDSRDRLAELLSVPVEFRSSSNSLPVPAVISLQDAMQNFEPDARSTVLEIKMRDLELARFRLAQPFAALADSYIAVLLDFLGDNKKIPAPSVAGKHGAAMRRTASVADTLKKLDALDARRREAEADLKSVILPQNLNFNAP